MATLSYKCKLCHFCATAESGRKYLCSVCFKKYEKQPATERPDLSTIPAEALNGVGGGGSTGTGTGGGWDEQRQAQINAGLAQSAPSKFMPLPSEDLTATCTADRDGTANEGRPNVTIRRGDNVAIHEVLFPTPPPPPTGRGLANGTPPVLTPTCKVTITSGERAGTEGFVELEALALDQRNEATDGTRDHNKQC